MATTLERKFAVDVTQDLTLASGWITINGTSAADDDIAPNLVDSTAFDTLGYSTKEVTLYDWTLAQTFFRRINVATYDAGQELVRARRGKFGTAARVGIRWYDIFGGPEAYSGIAIPTWKRNTGGPKDLEIIGVTYTGTDIPLNIGITNPIAGGAVPGIVGATPGSAGAAAAILIQGAGFTGVTGATHVTIGGVNATSYTVQSDGLISAVMPAGSAGSAPIIVTNAVGASAAFPYTRT